MKTILLILLTALSTLGAGTNMPPVKLEANQRLQTNYHNEPVTGMCLRWTEVLVETMTAPVDGWSVITNQVVVWKSSKEPFLPPIRIYTNSFVGLKVKR